MGLNRTRRIRVVMPVRLRGLCLPARLSTQEAALVRPAKQSAFQFLRPKTNPLNCERNFIAKASDAGLIPGRWPFEQTIHA